MARKQNFTKYSFTNSPWHWQKNRCRTTVAACRNHRC